MSPDPNNAIKARFFVTKSTVTIIAVYHGVNLSIRWDRSDDSHRHARTLARNLETLVQDGLNEVFVQDQARRLDFEIEEFFLDNDDKDRPDEN